MRASDVSMRMNSCSFDISRLKKPTVMSVVDADVLRDVQDEAGLAHRRARGDEHEVGRLQARRHLVEIDEAGGHAGDQPLVLLQLLDRREAALHEIAQRHEARRGCDPRRSRRSPSRPRRGSGPASCSAS